MILKKPFINYSMTHFPEKIMENVRNSVKTEFIENDEWEEILNNNQN